MAITIQCSGVSVRIFVPVPVKVMRGFHVFGRDDVQREDRVCRRLVHLSFVPDPTWTTTNNPTQLLELDQQKTFRKIPNKSEGLTNHQLPDVLPVKLTALLVVQRHCDPALDTLQSKHALTYRTLLINRNLTPFIHRRHTSIVHFFPNQILQC